MSDDKKPRPGSEAGYEEFPGRFEAAQPAEPGPLGLTAARGVGLLVGRTLGLQLLTAGVTIVLARILTPADYGLFAIALAVQMVGQQVAELGLPAALVRLDEEPSRELQGAVAGIMLSIALALAVAFLLIAFVVTPAIIGSSKTVKVMAIAACAMPFYAARAMPMVLMERRLRFGRVALVETADTLAFNGFALGAALAGFGAFSLAGAVPAGGMAGMLVAWIVQPFARRPRLDLGPIRPLAGFGVRVSILQGIYLLRELGFISIVAAVGGAPVAGFYAMAKRLFSFPIALTSAVFRVSYPALSRDAGLRPQRAARITTYTAIAAGLPLALVAGAAQPLIGVVLGPEWLPTADIVLVGSLGMMWAASANAAMNSYALAEGKANFPLIAAVVEAATACVLALVLTKPMGEAGVGAAITVSALASGTALAIGTHPLVRRSLVTVAKASLIATAATAAAQLLGVANDFKGLMLSLAAASVVWFALELAISRADLLQIARLVRPLLRKAAPS